jgi:hypothetical protein
VCRAGIGLEQDTGRAVRIVHSTYSGYLLQIIKISVVDPDPDPESKNDPQKSLKISFFVVLYVLFRGLKASPVDQKSFREACG